MDVITTHVNADFDALASMLAAAKLYPEAMLVFPGAQERNLRNFFVESTCYFYNFVKVKNLPFDRVRRLILVDTRQKDRIGPLGELADNPLVEIHAFDHHPDSPTDVAAAMQVVESTGATVTILTRLLREKGVELGEDEATLLALGIYEDTGNFTFVSTTPQDYEAAAWLLKQGANLNVVSSLITRELTADEVGLLNDLIHEAQRVIVNGVELVICQVSRDRYLPELAVLVHRFMDMDNLDAILVLARMEERVYLVARSRLPQVDVGQIAKSLGGGGHPTAASATLRDLTLVEARERLMTALQSHINPSRHARDLMTSPVITVEPATSIQEAHVKLTRYNINVLPVVNGEAVLGIISRQTVEKAIYHGLENLPVSEYMDQRVQPIAVDANLAAVEQAVVDRRQRLVPVMDQGRMVGVITRTDLLNTLIEHPVINEPSADALSANAGARQKNVTSLLRERLPRPVIHILQQLGRLADDLGYSVYLVGGSVRDLFLRRSNLDLDVVVEGDGILFARAVAQERKDVRVRAHKKFNTAKLIFSDGLIMDVATARLEYYQSPAALPVVEMSSIKLDLYRRDFTINTLAVKLNADSFGTLIDFFDGSRDIKEKAIRVLHNLSFVEDPTRVFRAVRFEQRFGFRIGKLTEGLIKNAIKIDAFRRLSGRRFLGELQQMLQEEKAVDCLGRLKDLRLLELFHPKLKLEPKDLALMEELEQALAWYHLSFLEHPLRRWLVIFLGLCDPLKDEDMEAFCRRLSMPDKLRLEIVEMRGLALVALNRFQRGPTPASVIYQMLKSVRPEYLLLIMGKASLPAAKKAVSQYLTSLVKVRPSLGGGDLLALGFAPGPIYRQILDRLLAARLDQEALTREDEAALVAREFGAQAQSEAS
ncbi:MAG: CBS domain-containing protein [Desulfarculus sp.]|nr:CBS domain-containing protein [Desulfarculus sp.]